MENEKINDYIMEIIKAEKPDSLERLLNLLLKECDIGKEEALKKVLEMENSGKIRLIEPPKELPSNIADYVFSESGAWFWFIMVISLLTMTMIFTVTVENTSLIFLRYIFGSVFLLFLPGYSFIKASHLGKNISSLEGLILSIGISVSILPVIGIILNYTPWGIRLTPVYIFLLFLIVSFALIGLLREYEQEFGKVF